MMGETSPCVAASTAVAVLTGSDTASHNAAAERTATNTPTTPTRLRLTRLEVIGEPAPVYNRATFICHLDGGGGGVFHPALPLKISAVANRQTSNTIFPNCSLSSRRRLASAARARGLTSSMTGVT